ncbi:Disease resistance protein RGA2 [Bienertia sinuspersici]
MAEFGILIAEKLMEVIGSEVIKEVCDMWNYKSQLDELKETVSTIHKVLLDADARRELSNADQDYMDKLKDAVYDADDLFDEFLTLAELKQLRPLSKRGKIYEKVRCFFSSKNQLGQAYRMSRDVKHIKKRLGDIADCHKKFGFNVDYKPIIRRREETCSYVHANEIIGREEDKEAIIEMLLDPNNEEICFTTIVGVGGLGKTALAQLVYDDERIKKEFSENMKLWVCVSDQEGEQFNVKTILCKILEIVTRKKFDTSSTMELVQHQFQERLRGQKYLLVLDDVWNEDREQWLNLRRFLMFGQSGSKVMVTTRSERTATIIGGKHVYNLDGLSRDDSWRLFEMLAFDKGHKCENHDELVQIGMKIVDKCYRIPLALKVVGSLLFGQSISMWHLVEDSGLAKIESGDNKIMSTLKLSYHNLTPSLKNCFSYCAIFPKDCRISKQMLIDLWMAHGYIMPLDEHQSLVDVAEQYFAILLQRCFFQDVCKTMYGDVESIKIHDLMHNVAQEAGREEICVVTYSPNTLGNKVRHLSYAGVGYFESTLGSSKIRSFICRGYGRCVVDMHTIENQMCLRVLELSNLGIEKLPNSIGKLQHLRYLNLSDNGLLGVLPNEITMLHNLQTLILASCYRLRELPKGFCRLVKLRHLDLLSCPNLICMPLGMEKLTSLEVLPYFMVGKTTLKDDDFEALKSLTRVRGRIWITIGENYGKEKAVDDNKGGYLKSMKHLNCVEINFARCCNNTEAVLKTLEPPSNVKELQIDSYKGKRIPWGTIVDNWAHTLSHLVMIKLCRCNYLEEIPVLRKLPLLKELNLQYLSNLEYMEINSDSLPINRLTNLEMSGDEGVDILLESGGMERCVLEKLASSLKRLEIDRMNRRRLLGEKGFQYFTALEDLTLSYIEEDNLEHCSFPQNLVSLRSLSSSQIASSSNAPTHFPSKTLHKSLSTTKRKMQRT